jgi:hypothetical protein
METDNINQGSNGEAVYSVEAKQLVEEQDVISNKKLIQEIKVEIKEYKVPDVSVDWKPEFIQELKDCLKARKEDSPYFGIPSREFERGFIGDTSSVLIRIESARKLVLQLLGLVDDLFSKNVVDKGYNHENFSCDVLVNLKNYDGEIK